MKQLNVYYIISILEGCTMNKVKSDDKGTDKSVSVLMEPCSHNITLNSLQQIARFFTYSPLIFHYVIPSKLLGEVWCQHIETSSEFGKHHVDRETCGRRHHETRCVMYTVSVHFGR